MMSKKETEFHIKGLNIRPNHWNQDSSLGPLCWRCLIILSMDLLMFRTFLAVGLKAASMPSNSRILKQGVRARILTRTHPLRHLSDVGL